MSDIQLFNGDCLEVMEQLIKYETKVDAIITDPPYGTVSGLKTDGWQNTDLSWDKKINTKAMFNLSEKILRQNGILILFSQEPYTCELRTSATSNIKFAYPLLWIKNHFCNYLACKKAPVSYFEDLSVFYKEYDSECSNPLRNYFNKVLTYIGMPKIDIMKKLGHQKADHVFRIDSMQFSLCSKAVYTELITVFGIDKMEGFLPYETLKNIYKNHSIRTFNLPLNQKYKSNILKYDKEKERFHPTQKPINLIEDLIKTYTNEGDTVLDFTMGSGTTGVACVNTNRKFIGIELDEKYFNIAKQRIEDCLKQKEETNDNQPNDL